MEWTYRGGKIVVDFYDPTILALGRGPVLAYPAQYKVDGKTIPFTVYGGGDEGMESLVRVAEGRVDMGLVAPA